MSDKYKKIRLEELGKQELFPGTDHLIPKEKIDSLRNNLGPIYVAMYDMALQSNYMADRFEPIVLKDAVMKTVRQIVSNGELAVTSQMPYLINAFYAAHQDTSENIFKNDQSTGSIYLIRDIAKEFPKETYDSSVARDMIKQLENDPKDSHAVAIGTTLNLYSKAGKLPATMLAETYLKMDKSRHQLKILADLSTSIPHVAAYAAENVLDNGFDAKELEMDHINPLFKVAIAAMNEKAFEISDEALRRMEEYEEGNTYYRMRAAREMEEVIKIYPEDDSIEAVADRVIALTKKSMINAKNYTPRDENQALNDYICVLSSVVQRLPQRAAEIEELASEINNLVEKEDAKPERDWNWGLSLQSLTQLKETTALAQNKPAPQLSAKEQFKKDGMSMLEQLLMSGNLFGGPKPTQP